MSQVELLWAVVSLLLLGALVSMCMKCQQDGSKQEKKGLNSQRNQCEDQQIFEVVRSYSMSRQEQLKTPHNTPKTSKSSKHRSIPSHAETQTDQEAAYVEPICVDYYNCRKFLRPPSEDSSHSYQNVAGPSNGTGYEVGIYENSAALKLWQTPPGSGSSDDDEEEDYVNAGPGCPPRSRGMVTVDRTDCLLLYGFLLKNWEGMTQQLAESHQSSQSRI